MGKRVKKSKGVVKGAPSGFMVSLMVHAGAILLAGMLVVFSVTQKVEKKFVPPPPVDRPKMKLKKPRVQVKKTAKPKSTTRIVTKITRSAMPDIQLPEMSGMGDGVGGGFGGFDIVPDIEEVTVFGASQTIGNDFVGTFYDFKRDRKGNGIYMDDDKFLEEVSKFVRSGWKVSRLASYYRSPKKLYATSFMVPTTLAELAPASFGSPDTVAWAWAAHYKGQLVYPEDITLRFWGQGDDVLIVRVNNEVVLNASYKSDSTDRAALTTPMWRSRASGSRLHVMGNNTAEGGDWITLKAGVPVPMEVLLGEAPGGHFDCMLCVEVKGEDYPMNKRGGPTYPMFVTEKPTHALLDAIIPLLNPGEASLTNGPIFKDF